MCLWVKPRETVDLDATRKHGISIKSMCVGENVYLCPCFCGAPKTSSGNLLSRLVNYSPGGLAHLFPIPVELYLTLKLNYL